MATLSYSNPVIMASAPETKFVLCYPNGDVKCYGTLDDAQADQATFGGTLMNFIRPEEMVAFGKPEPKPASVVPDGMKTCLLKGKKRFCKPLGDYRMDIYQRNEDNTVGLWVGTFNTADRVWEAELEDM